MGTVFVDEIKHQSAQGSGTITIGASGETVNVVGTLQNNGAGVGGANTPAFLAYRSSNQSLTDAVVTKVQFDIKEFDTDNCFDNVTNYRFTPTTAGKYFLFGNVFVGGASPTTAEYSVRIQKNGTNISRIEVDRRTAGAGYNNSFLTSTISIANGSTDYFDLHVVQVGGGTKNILSGIQNTYFGSYKIIE